ncbi:MAG: chemotaxis protein CheW [Dokdonella sp.]
MSELAREIRALMIPVTNGRLLLPNATVAEVIAYATPEDVADAPVWLLGRIVWRGWSLPLVSFSRLAGLGEEVPSSTAKVAVLKALNGDAKLPFMAVLTQGFPRLITVTQDMLVPSGDENRQASGVLAEVLIRDDAAIIPDLGTIEDMITEALAA